MPLTAEQGAKLVRLARRAVEASVRGDVLDGHASAPEGFLEELRGAFVTLVLINGELRGCIGFPYPVKPLGEAVVEAAMSAASQDPRFPPVEPSELDGILVEVSALTRPEPIAASGPAELPKKVRVGMDGLIVSSRGASGLLLPQVASEYNLSSEEFLSNTCMKAGLMPDAWLTGGVQVLRFQAEVFSERSPRGDVRREARLDGSA